MIRNVWFTGCIIISIFSIVLFSNCKRANKLFKEIASSQSHIYFNNKIEENDSINPLDLEYLYNGGGVAVGDFDNNGLQDLYFTASTTPNRLYLNKGHFKFEDVTTEAKVEGAGRWANGASVVDINNDGWKDIYVCTTLKKDPEQRKNLLYINQGLNENNIPVFKEMATAYGLADTSHSVHAAFFDYDNDGDLDMYLVTTKPAGRTAAQFSSNQGDTTTTDMDKLFRNDWSTDCHHPVFTDVSLGAGITKPGYGLGVAIADINKDGYKDVYVTNDFFTSDHLFINNRNGTFSDKLDQCFKHTSQNAMGNDIADINNDGLVDVVSVDMNPEDNYRKKKNMGSNNYYLYQEMMSGNYSLQYVRNTLQLNQGLQSNDSISEPIFSEIGFYAGIAETDWSWNVSLADFDNDSYRDILITNGYPKDVTDHDFASFRYKASPNTAKQELLAQIPQIKVANYAFHNSASLRFTDVTDQWGLRRPTFSNGAVYVDLDNDGDLDYVINNINDVALLYENTIITEFEIKANFLEIQLVGDTANRNAIGAVAQIFYDKDKMQVCENSPYRGYLSTVSDQVHFGLGKTSFVDSLVVTWPSGERQLIEDIRVNQKITIKFDRSSLIKPNKKPIKTESTLFADVTTDLAITYQHREIDEIDFDKERLLPHKLSQYGPGLAAGDLDGNGYDDLVIGGNSLVSATVLLQKPNGKFTSSLLPDLKGKEIRKPENMGILPFDVDGDHDIDLYMANGSNEYFVNTKNYQDRLYLNDGKANFTLEENALPSNHTSKSCVKAADYDGDGDLDLFVGGRVLPGSYPLPVSSFIYRNDSRKGHIEFTDVTNSLAPDLKNLGMVCDAIWTDFDNDGWMDLIIAGEWMPLRFFRNTRGRLIDITAQTGVNSEVGWWNSIAGGDFDNDGDTDYLIGNFGENSFFKASKEYPLNIYAKDYDENTSIDAITTVYLKDQTGIKREYTAHNRDDINNQLPGLKKRFFTYKEFGNTEFSRIFSKTERKNELHLMANNFKSCFLKNLGAGKFILQPLPVEAQIAPLYGMDVADYNKDGNLDAALVGNEFGMEVSNGRLDAFNGLILVGNGKGNFRAETIPEAGFFVPGNAKAICRLRKGKNGLLLAATQNNGPLKVFCLKNRNEIITMAPLAQWAMVFFKNGKKRKEEFYYGSSFLSHSSRFMLLDSSMDRVQIVDQKVKIVKPSLSKP